MPEPMTAMELDDVRRWAEQRTNPDDGGTTVAETYLRLLATVADSRRAALYDALAIAQRNGTNETIDDIRALLDSAGSNDSEPENTPIGKCPRCGVDVYTAAGFCGRCQL